MLGFYDTLELAMRMRDMRPADLADKCETVTPSYLSRLKNGYTKSVSWEKALEIISALGMKPSEFYELQMSDERP